ncbi:MAG: fumarylacetoacetate hydrolase family protein [Proteobacteria bacterium]|jgi:2-keto-4-pentenoate hydratase/2-oxohepta-3-ene-1,7-dioic acid hydratase in catechol pathway|nr:fumarylacetoacetate hydrolase family protein [Pseudomonadota bacterium]
MTQYHLLNFIIGDGQVCPGILVNGQVYSLAENSKNFSIPKLPTSSLLEILNSWEQCAPILLRIAAEIDDSAAQGIALDEVKLDIPVRYPQALYCAGANYIDHLEEMTGKKPNKDEMSPFFFMKPPQPTMVPTKTTVAIPEFTKQLDWEAEIAIVIGKEAREVNLDDAMNYVAGFTILNDLSARDLMKRFDVPFLFDWIGQKCFMGAAPTGPWITPLSAVKDPNNLDIKLWVNDALHQDSNSSQLIFDYAEQIENLSKHVTLYPGDIIATGTPAGVGHGKGVYLKPGDVIRIEIEELGELITYIEEW